MPTTTRRLAVAAALALAPALVACGGDSTSESSATSSVDVGIDLTSEVDPQTGAIIFPYERLVPSEEERAVLDTAAALLVAQCAQSQGVDWTASTVIPYSTLYDSSMYFGVWTQDQASRFAFFGPATNADLVANGAVEAGTVTVHDGSPEQPDLSDLRAVMEHNSAVDDAGGEIVTACAESSEIDRIQVVDLFTGPWSSALASVGQGFDSLDEVEAIQDELDSCLEDNGLSVDPDTPGMPLGWDVSVIDEEQIQLALQVVDCKTQIDFVPRLADLMAEQQAPILVEYADELLAERATVDEMVTEARSVIAAAQTAG